MKILSLLFLLFLINTGAHAQILKKLGKDLENDARWKIRSKANQKIDQAIDTLLSQPKKMSEKKNSEKTTDPAPQQNKANIKTSSKENTNNNDEMSITDGYVKLSVSAEEVFKNGTVVIYGNSLKYGSLQTVKVNIKGPETNETETLDLLTDGAFSKGWQPGQSGDFVITAISSDGKAKDSRKVKVLDMELTDWEVNEEETDKAYEQLKKDVDKVEQQIGNKDKAELEEKMDQLNEKVKLVKKLFEDLGMAMKELGNMSKKGVVMPSSLTKNLSQLNDLMFEQRMQMQKLTEAANHQPYDNTICEYLVLVNEACAAFSTFSNVWSKSAVTIIKNISVDKLLPKGVEAANNSAKVIPADYDAQFKQPAKIFAASKVDAEGLASKMGAGGFAGDIIQFATDYLLKKYCGVFKGELKHNYTITYRNKDGATWWSYRYETAAAVTFRYPKTSNGKVIKMKGNIEGNATKFTFFQNVELLDEFREAMKGRAKLIPVQLIKPLAVPFATSQNDELGFGAVARGIATPSYFNIPIDGEYDVDGETVRLFVNNAIMDFTPLVKYTYGFIAIAAGIPLVTRVDFPINKARLTLNAVVSQENELKVKKSPTNGLIITGKGSRHIGETSSAIEHMIDYSITVQN